MRTPPEMIQKGCGTYVSDIYATGVTLYGLLTGAWPFNGATDADVFEAIVQGRYDSLRGAAPHVSRRLADRVERAMAFAEADRYQTWRGQHDAIGDPNLVRRSWERIVPHPNHLMCWVEPEAAAGTTHQVCVWDAGGGRFEVEARRATGARSRITAHCGTAANDRALRIHLRRTVDRL